MKNYQKKLLLTSALVSVCGCFALVACGEVDKPDVDPTAFDAPTNLAVEVNVLSWSAVTGAAQYTVKINSDETTVVTAPSLDLTTVTAKLNEGDNALSVKVNATTDKLESSYSATVTYVYTPTPGPSPFAKPEIKLAGDVLSWNAITGAAQYVVKINSDETTEVAQPTIDLTTVTNKLNEGENTLSVKVKATADKPASDYSDPVTYIYSPAPTAFDAPTASLSGDTLSWNGVTGATNGYTVKINDDETTKVTSGTSLDLTTVTGKLHSGENKLYVKVNATANKLESAYSTAVDYSYTPAVETEAADYKALVNAIGSITENSTAQQADAVSKAIAAAQNKYTGMSAGAKALEGVIADKAAFDAKKSAFDGVYDPARSAYDQFATALAAATAEVTKAQSLVDLNTAKAAAEEKHGALNALALSMVTNEQSTAYTALASTVTAWTTDVNSAKTALTYEFQAIENDDAKAEANILKAVELLDEYDDYAAYVKADADVAAKHTAITTAKTAAENQIKATVAALKEQLPADGTETLTIDYYDELTDLKKSIDALGAYAKSQWAKADTDKVIGEIERVETTPVEDTKKSDIFVTGADSGKITVIFEVRNVLGHTIALKDGDNTLGELALEITVNDGEKQSVSLALNNDFNRYIYQMDWTRSSVAGKFLSIKYAIDGGAEVSVEYTGSIADIEGVPTSENKFTDADMWFFPNNQYNAFKDDEFYFNNGSAFIDIYRADELVINNDNSLSVYGLPIIKGVPVTSEVTREEDLRHYIAVEYPELIGMSQKVKFMIYKTNDGQANGQRKTLFHFERVSHDDYTLTLTAEDAKYKLDLGNAGTVVDAGGNVTIGAAYNEDGLVAQFNNAEVTKANLHEQLAYKVYVTDGQQEEKTVIINCVSGGSIGASDMQKAIFGAFGKTGEYTIKLQLVLRENSEFGEVLKGSEIRQGAENPWKVTVTLPDNEKQVRFNTTTGSLEFFRDTKNGTGSVFNFGVDYVELQLKKDEQIITAYFKMTENPTDFGNEVHLYKTLDAESGLNVHGVRNAYAEGDFNTWIASNYDMQGFDAHDGWELRTKVHYDSDYGVTSEYSEMTKWVTDEIENRDDPLPVGNQLNLTAGSDYLEFIRTTVDGNSGENGWVLTHGVNYIVVKIHINAGDTAGHVAYLVPDKAQKGAALKMYAGIDSTTGAGVGGALDCAIVSNGYVTVADLKTWMAAAYDDIASADDFKIEEAEFYTALVSDGKGNYVASDGIVYCANAVTVNNKIDESWKNNG